jgi:hypothetical protein
MGEGAHRTWSSEGGGSSPDFDRSTERVLPRLYFFLLGGRGEVRAYINTSQYVG